MEIFFDFTVHHEETVVTANSPVLPTAASTYSLPAGLSRGLSDNPDIQEVLDRAPTLHAAATVR